MIKNASFTELTPYVSVGMDCIQSKQKGTASSGIGLEGKVGIKALWHQDRILNPYVSADFVLGQNFWNQHSVNRFGVRGQAGLQIDLTRDGSVSLPMGIYVEGGKAHGSLGNLSDLASYQGGGLATGLSVHFKNLNLGLTVNYGARTFLGSSEGYTAASLSEEATRGFGLGFQMGWSSRRKSVVADLPVLGTPAVDTDANTFTVNGNQAIQFPGNPHTYHVAFGNTQVLILDANGPEDHLMSVGDRVMFDGQSWMLARLIPPLTNEWGYVSGGVAVFQKSEGQSVGSLATSTGIGLTQGLEESAVLAGADILSGEMSSLPSAVPMASTTTPSSSAATTSAVTSAAPTTSSAPSTSKPASSATLHPDFVTTAEDAWMRQSDNHIVAYINENNEATVKLKIPPGLSIDDFLKNLLPYPVDIEPDIVEVAFQADYKGGHYFLTSTRAAGYFTPIVTKYDYTIDKNGVLRFTWTEATLDRSFNPKSHDQEFNKEFFADPAVKRKLKEAMGKAGKNNSDEAVNDYIADIIEASPRVQGVYGHHYYDPKTGYYEYQQRVGFGNWLVESAMKAFGDSGTFGAALKVAYNVMQRKDYAGARGSKGKEVIAMDGKTYRASP